MTPERALRRVAVIMCFGPAVIVIANWLSALMSSYPSTILFTHIEGLNAWVWAMTASQLVAMSFEAPGSAATFPGRCRRLDCQTCSCSSRCATG